MYSKKVNIFLLQYLNEEIIMHHSIATATPNTAFKAMAKQPTFLRKITLQSFIRSTFCVSLALVGQAVVANEQIAASEKVDSAKYSGGVTIGSLGLGLSLSAKSDWSLTAGDQIQWRVLASGIDAEFEGDDDVDIAGVDYKDGEFSLFSLQGGVDWYPVSTGWADEVFVSTGLMYFDAEFKGTADNDKTYFVGNTKVSSGDITSLNVEIENSSVMPYLSVGWGNKITPEGGFDFQAEVGVALPTNDPDVTVSAVDPGNFLTANALKAEKKELEDEVDGAVGFVTATISYHF